MNDLLPPWIALDLFWEQVAIEGISALDENRGNDAAHLWHTAELLCASFDAHDPRRAATMTNQGAALEQQGRTEEAETRYREALVLWDGVSGWIERMTVELQAKSAHFHRRLEVRHGPELKKLRRHIQGRLNQGGAAATWTNLARLLTARGKIAEAEEISAPAVEARGSGIGHRDSGLAKACDARAACLEALDRNGEAVELREKAAAIREDPSSPGPVRLAKEGGGKMTDERRLMAAAYFAVTL
jgi:tetratricopeptide (TPR) repeat protein